MIDFDQLREGAKIVQGDPRYAVNPLKIQCMLDNGKCAGHRHLGKMSYPADIWIHYQTAHKVLHPVNAMMAISIASALD